MKRKTKKKAVIRGKTARILLETAEDIIAHSMRFDMDDWIDTTDDLAPCKTTACIAGFICMREQLTKTRSWRLAGLKLKKKNQEDDSFDYEKRMREITGLSDVQALCYLSHWPNPFYEDYNWFENKQWEGNQHSYYRRMKAQITAARIEYFVETGK